MSAICGAGVSSQLERSISGLAWARRAVAVGLIAAAAGCASIPERVAPPQSIFRAVEPVGFSAVRTWSDTFSPVDVASADRGDAAIERLVAQAAARGPNARFSALALSGGAADGAFGAGLLRGWNEIGERPVFDVVTGVSTGALIAPFAFLGPEYDEALEELYVSVATDDIVVLRPLKALFGGALSLGDVSPLEERIARAVTQEMLDEIAEEYRKGRFLLVATTNLDARESVIWNMGEIAAQGGIGALPLFRRVMLASASIPGAFPPVFVDVEGGGARYQEMHVDGGVTNSVFFAPLWLSLADTFETAPDLQRDVYVLQNNKISEPYEETPSRLVEIASTGFSTLIRGQTRGDHLRIFSIAQRTGFDFNLAFVPEDFDVESTELFDPVYMRALYDVGVAEGRRGDDAWLDEPPSLPASLRAAGAGAQRDIDAAAALAVSN